MKYIAIIKDSYGISLSALIGMLTTFLEIQSTIALLLGNNSKIFSFFKANDVLILLPTRKLALMEKNETPQKNR
jgi:hypothetical protein